MNRYFKKKLVVAVSLVAFLGILCVCNLLTTSLSLDLENGIAEGIAKLEASINEQAFGKFWFLDAYGAAQKLQGKNELNDFEVVKAKDGSLHYTHFSDGPEEKEELIEALNELRLEVEDDDTKFFYVMTPDKYIPGYTEFSRGLPYNYANENADLFLKGLKKNKINSIDLREHILNSDLEKSELFYKTDHHWKIETAFYAFTCLVEELGKYYKFKEPIIEEAMNLDNYNKVVYEKAYVGSMARKTGAYYGEVDDFTMLYPKFPTEYRFTATTNNNHYKTAGKFEHALMSMVPFTYTGSHYDPQADKYSSYLYGNQGIAHIRNKNVKGPKVLIVKDSFMVPVAAFLSTVCSDVYLVDVRYYDGNVTEYVKSKKNLDFVMVSYTPQDLVEEFFLFK